MTTEAEAKTLPPVRFHRQPKSSGSSQPGLKKSSQPVVTRSNEVLVHEDPNQRMLTVARKLQRDHEAEAAAAKSQMCALALQLEKLQLDHVVLVHDDASVAVDVDAGRSPAIIYPAPSSAAVISTPPDTKNSAQIIHTNFAALQKLKKQFSEVLGSAKTSLGYLKTNLSPTRSMHIDARDIVFLDVLKECVEELKHLADILAKMDALMAEMRTASEAMLVGSDTTQCRERVQNAEKLISQFKWDLVEMRHEVGKTVRTFGEPFAKHAIVIDEASDLIHPDYPCRALFFQEIKSIGMDDGAIAQSILYKLEASWLSVQGKDFSTLFPSACAM